MERIREGVDMPLEERELVTVEVVSDVQPIPGADAIEMVTVRGWRVATRIGEFAVGDPCLYFEIDSLLPVGDPRFAFLAPRGTKQVDGVSYHRLKTARLRGAYSQGLVMPISAFPGIYVTRESLQEAMGVIKYDPPAVTARSDIVGPFPAHLGQKTDSERVQNLASVWHEIVESGPWTPTEKVDGTSMSVFRDREGVLRVCGRNYEIAEGANLYWNAVTRHRLGDFLEPGHGLQCEIFGEGVQGNPLGAQGVRVAVFDFLVEGKPQPRDKWPEKLEVRAVPVLDLDFPVSVADAVAQADRVDSAITPGRLAEGIVWHQSEGNPVAALGYRTTFKVVSNRYLLKHDDKDK